MPQHPILLPYLSASEQARAALSPAERIAMLHGFCGTSTEYLLKAAAMYEMMLRNHDDVSSISRGRRRELQSIIDGEVLPEVYTKFTKLGQARVRSLPMHLQQQFIQPHARISVATPNGVKIVAVEELTNDQWMQLIKSRPGQGACLRTLTEQREWLLSHFLKRPAPAHPATAVLDYGRQEVRIGGLVISKQELINWLAELNANLPPLAAPCVTPPPAPVP